jgi:hypothetical protein
MQMVDSRRNGPAVTAAADRQLLTVAALGGAAIVAGGLVAAVNAAAPFAHGSWLSAYLVLVAGVSQLVLGVGARALPVNQSPVTTRHVQVALWNLGNVAVAAGVLGDAAVAVAAGSGALLAALGSFALGVGRGRRRARRWVVAYHAAIAVLAVSVGIGCALAGAIPGPR